MNQSDAKLISILFSFVAGDYVTLYQHQRKKINERMREREEAVAKLSFEKEQMQVITAFLNFFSIEFKLGCYKQMNSKVLIIPAVCYNLSLSLFSFLLCLI